MVSSAALRRSVEGRAPETAGATHA
jgi:hypothetical protein